MTSYLKAGLACFVLLAGTAAHATAITFDFTGNSSNNVLGLDTGNLGTSQITVSSGDITANIFGISDATTGQSGNLHRNKNKGLGVSGAPSGNQVGVNESLLFDFNPVSVIAMSSLLFETGSGDGQLDLYVDDAYYQTIAWAANPGASTFEVFFNGIAFGSRFEFRGIDDSFRVRAFSVSTVPEPTALALFGLGLICFGVARRKRNSVAV